jgi:hypothetical protein
MGLEGADLELGDGSTGERVWRHRCHQGQGAGQVVGEVHLTPSLVDRIALPVPDVSHLCLQESFALLLP